MRDLVILFVHLIATLARLLGPGGIRSVVAESVLIKQQLLILNRSRQRSPNLRSSDRLVAGLCALLIRPARLIRSAIVLKPSTLLSLHRTLRNRKYRLLFSSKRGASPVQRDRPENSSKPSSKPNSAIPRGAVRELLSRLPWLSTSQSTRTLFEGFSLVTIDLNRLRWTLLADLHWAFEGQPLEYRSVPVRISHVADPLGPGRHGSIHAPDHWVRRPCRNSRWYRALPDVQPGHSRAPSDAEVPQLRPRSAVSVQAMASQSANPGGSRNQDDALCSPVSSVRGAADWDDSKGVFGSHVILDDR